MRRWMVMLGICWMGCGVEDGLVVTTDRELLREEPKAGIVIPQAESTPVLSMWRTRSCCQIGRYCDIREISFGVDGSYHLRIHHQDRFLDASSPIVSACENGMVRGTEHFSVLVGCDGLARFAGQRDESEEELTIGSFAFERIQAFGLGCQATLCETSGASDDGR